MSDFLNKLASSVLGGEGNDSLMTTLKGQLLGATGGLSGLVEKFKANGLGDIVASWIGNGKNLPISADQIQQVLGSDQLTALAAKIGLPLDALKQQLANFLPTAVDQMTPDGKVPE